MEPLPSPLEVLSQWFAALPPEIARWIGFEGGWLLIGTIIPGQWDDLGTGHDDERFQAAMTPRAGDDERQIAGRALAFASAIDCVFAGNTDEGWAAHVAEIERMLKWAEEKGSDLARLPREFLDRAPLRGAMWTREAQRWGELRAGALSPRVVSAWVAIESHRAMARHARRSPPGE